MNDNLSFKEEVVETSDIDFTTIIDYNNDGRVDLLITPPDFTQKASFLKRNETLVSNQRPQKPINLSYTSVSNFGDVSILRFNWSNGGDDLTQYPTYNLYLKNKTTNDVIYAPHSNFSTGHLTKLEKGNMEYLTQWEITKELPEGVYEWKVQAVDQGYLGSEWAVGDDFTILSTSTVDNENDKDYMPFPNTTYSKLYLSNIDKIKKIQLISINGQILLEFNSDFKEIDISELRSSVYFLVIQEKEGFVKTIKIIKI